MSNGPFAVAQDSDGLKIFVENACPGDKLTATIYDHRKTFAFAHIDSIDQPSSLRMLEPKCKLHKICGSCQWQHIDYQAQLKFKKTNLIDQLLQSGIDFTAIPDLEPMEDPWFYRNKIIYPVKSGKKSQVPQIGYFK